MPRYHFDTADGSRYRDIEGTVLPNLGAARTAAIRYAGDVISDQPELLDASQTFKVEVTDDAGQALFTVVTKLEDGKAAV